MQQTATVLFSRVVVYSLLVVAFLGLLVSRIRHRLKVSPEQTTHAPVLWLVSLTADARLHRRLRGIASAARTAAQGGRRHSGRDRPTHAQILARDIEREVITLDDRLIAVLSLDLATQHREIKQLRAEADRADDLVERVSKLLAAEGSDPSLASNPDGLAELDARLARLEASQQANSVIDVAPPVSRGVIEAEVVRGEIVSAPVAAPQES